MGTKADTDRTRSNMIEAAGELFAKHGYHGVSVRDICTRASASLSALNYHFRDKDGLFKISQGVHNMLEEKKIPHIYRVIPGGRHDFAVWKSDLYHFAQLVFRDPTTGK